MCTGLTRRDREEGKGYLLHQQEIYSVRVSLHFAGENILCSDVAFPEAETLLVFIHHISHFQNGYIEVHFPESDANWKVSQMANAVE